MKVDKNNFWVKLNEQFYDERPRTLCGFFWKSIFAFAIVITSPLNLLINAFTSILERKFILNIIFAIIVIDKIIQFFAFIIILPVKNNEFINWSKYPIIYLKTIIVIIIVIIIFSLIANACIHLYEKYETYKYTRRKITGYVEKPKKPNVLWESFKALKSKVCPLIEYEYENK